MPTELKPWVRNNGFYLLAIFYHRTESFLPSLLLLGSSEPVLQNYFQMTYTAAKAMLNRPCRQQVPLDTETVSWITRRLWQGAGRGWRKVKKGLKKKDPGLVVQRARR